MAKAITNKKIAKNVVISISVQAISLLVSFIANFFVPKFIDKSQYSLWQMFMLYQGYVGIMHFGLLDGLILRYSQYDYDELDKSRLRSQFKLLLAFTSIVALLMSGVVLLTMQGAHQIVFVLVALAIISKNYFTYTSYTFQITNRVNKYASLIIMQRGIYGLVIVALLVFGVTDFYWFCLAEFIGDLVATLIMSFFNKGLYFGKSIPFKQALKELKDNIGAGGLLLLANWSFIFIVSSARMVVQWVWGEVVFADVSFAFSVTNMFLTFATAISVVLFPSLKRVESERLHSLYGTLRGAISLILCAVLILYFPGCYVLSWWLPHYQSSLIYLGMMLPIIIYSSKVSLLTNSYLKVYRKEKAMAIINLCSIGVGLILSLIGAYVIKDLRFILISTVIVLAVNSLVAELIVNKLVGEKNIIGSLSEILLSIGFIITATLLPLWWGMVAYIGLFAVYLVVNIKTVKGVILALIRKKEKTEVCSNENENLTEETKN